MLIGKAEMFGVDGVAALSEEMKAAIELLREGGHTTMIVRRDTLHAKKVEVVGVSKLTRSGTEG